MFGAKLTLIVLTSQRLARIDLAGPRRQLRVQRAMSCPAGATTELAAAIAIAYRLGESTNRNIQPARMLPRTKRSAIVLSDDIWNDTITLPLDVTVLLPPAELQQALAIEAENYSGISAFSSRFASVELVDTSSKLLDASTNFASTNTWWVSQASAHDMASMQTAAQACGFHLLGASHTLAYQCTDRTRTISRPDLEDQSGLLAFGTEWARTLSDGGSDLLIRPEANASGKHQLGWLQTSAALVTALACAGTYYSRVANIDCATSQLKQLQQTLTEVDSTATKLRSAQAHYEQLHQQRSNAPAQPHAPPRLVKQPDRFAYEHNARWLAIFDALTTCTPEDCCIESWHTSEDALTVVGRAITAQAVHELASRLEQSLDGQGWQVQPPRVLQDESSLLRFEVPLLPQLRTGGWQ